MKVSSTVMPAAPYQILRDGRSCTVEFYDNVQSAETTDGLTGKKVPSWDFEKYTLSMPYSPNLAAQIDADYATWLQQARNAEAAVEAQNVRNYRDDLLNTADVKYCNAEKWNRMTSDQQQAWETYKQQLRDVPTQDGFPSTVNWPAMPADTATYEGGPIHHDRSKKKRNH